MLQLESSREGCYTPVDLERLLCAYQEWGIPFSTRICHWNVMLVNGNFCCISLCPGSGENMEVPDLIITGVLPDSKPVVVYPCRSPKNAPPFSLPAKAGAHWLIRAMRNEELSGVVACRGGSRVWSTLLLPEWFVDRQHLNEGEIEDAVFAALGTRRRRGCTIMCRIPCALPMQLLALMANWNGENASARMSRLPGHTTWCYFLDACGQGELRTQMYCHDTHRLCINCPHASHAAYTIDASGMSL